jgi:8-oxo-dGTP pyrophosphatase MutT (NUDIX family)
MQDTAGVVRVVLTQRSARLTTHQGEVCLPGGKRDPTDADDVACALREAYEELAIPPGQVEVVAKLPPFLSKHKLSVTPVIGILHALPQFIPNEAEVDAVFDMPLAAFLEDSPAHSHMDTQWGSLPYRIHYFQYETFNVWGLTAAILIQVAELGFGRPPAFSEYVPGAKSFRQM